MNYKQNYLTLSWSTSRGRDTYGYNICRLDDRATDIRYKCMGGGYDMIGTVIGQWLANQYQDRLQALVTTNADKLKPYGSTSWKSLENYYGLTVKPNGFVYLDGACGKESMIKIARAIGVDITDNYNRRKRCTDGYFVAEFDNGQALIDAGR